MSDEGSLNVLLAEILEDFQDSLKAARNAAAKRKILGRVDRVKRAIAQNERLSVSGGVTRQLPRPAND
jgi:putative component of toxin-antitoxin plasmid stabilization module